MSWLSSLFKTDNSAQQQAEQARWAQYKAEENRQQNIREGQGKIDEAFGQFNPAYFDKYRQAFGDFYLPQIQDQYAKAKDKLTAVLAGRGMLESSVGAQKFADTERTRADAAASVGNQGMDAANKLKSQVESAKGNLYQLNASVADPSMMASQAAGAASSFAAPPTLSPIGQVFQSTLQGFGQYNKADASSMNPQLPWNSYGGAPIAGAGSSRIG